MSLQNLFVQDSGKSSQDVYCDELVCNTLTPVEKTASLGLTGPWGEQTVTIRYSIVGKFAHVYIPETIVLATSSGVITSFGTANPTLPAELQPIGLGNGSANVIEAGAPALGSWEVNTSGVVAFSAGALGILFSTAANAGFKDTTLVYRLV